MPINKNLSRISLCLSFLFCVLFLFSPKGWGSGFSAEDLADMSAIPMRTPLEEEIPVFTQDAFENLGVRIGGTTFSSSTFREKANGHVWIGKAEVLTRTGTEEPDLEAIESLACRAKIASDIYGFYGVKVPRTVLSPQKMTNTGIDTFEGREAMHIMSRKVEGYHDYCKQFRFVGFIANLDPTYGPMVCHDSRCTMEGCGESRESRHMAIAYETEGTGKATAVATWLHDIDFIGASATNIGYRIASRSGQVIAEFVVVDPGESFSDPATFPYPPPRHIRFAMPGTDAAPNTVAFERLFPEESRARNEFLMTLHDIIDTDERTIVRFFTRRGAEFFVSRDPRSAPGLTRQLMERKTQLALHYAPELAASRAKYEEQREAVARVFGAVGRSDLAVMSPPIVRGDSSGVAATGGAIARPLGPAIPDIAKGHEDIYLRFVKGSLIYKPNKDNDVGNIELPFAALPNPLEGTFDLSSCGDTGKYLSISTGYRRGKKADNMNKTEVWIVPKFVVEKDQASSARHLTPIFGVFTAPVGLFWTWGSWDNMEWYDYLASRPLDGAMSNIYENWKKRHTSGVRKIPPKADCMQLFIFNFS